MIGFDIAEENIGALTFIMDAYDKHMFNAEKAFTKVTEAGIKGDKLYMLWNDCCNRNTDMAVKIMLEHTIEDILEHINYEHGRGIPYINE
jgi:hypothetical protein